MDRNSKKELLNIIDDQNKNLLKYKSRLHDIVESYKHLVKEKETLEDSVKFLTATNKQSNSAQTKNPDNTENETSGATAKAVDDDCIQQLKNNLGALTEEKARIENEMKVDRKKILQQREELESSILEKESKWIIEKQKMDSIIIELRRKVSLQQQEREKEQHDHVLMLKELQNVVASERVGKEKLEEQMGEIQQKFINRLPEKKMIEYEKCVGELQNKLTVAQGRMQTSENELRKMSTATNKLKEELEDVKVQYSSKLEEEKHRADMADEKLNLLTLVKEKRIASLETKIAELSSVVGDHDKLRQQDLHAIQKLKARISQLQTECSMFSHPTSDVFSHRDTTEVTFGDKPTVPKRSNSSGRSLSSDSDYETSNIHAQCNADTNRLKEELEQYKKRAESALRERYSKSSANLLSDVKTSKELKDLKSRITQLEDQLHSCRSQLKLNEEYHNRITANLEKSSEELKNQHRQQLINVEAVHENKMLELEQQIQKQRERTLALLGEKDKEIAQLRASFHPATLRQAIIHTDDMVDDCFASPSNNPDIASSLLSSTPLMSGKQDGHILHYLQEISRKDVELTNLRHLRIQSESCLRKLEQEVAEERSIYQEELDCLRSRVCLLESSQDERGTNVEYLKNVVLRFLKCRDVGSKRHMVNAIATVLHFTSSEVQEIKTCIV